jgi:hypothetical protein
MSLLDVLGRHPCPRTSLIGDEAFFAALREWFNRYGGGPASTEDYVDLAEDVSSTDLTRLFHSWLHDDAMERRTPDSGVHRARCRRTVPDVNYRDASAGDVVFDCMR